MKKLLSIVILSLASPLALADIGDNFFSIKLGSSDSDKTGISTFTDQTGDAAQTSDNDLGDSNVLGIGAGTYFSESFSGEISISQRKGFKYNTTVSDATQKYTADVESLAVFINGYLNSQPLSILQTSVTPYLCLGVGVSRNKMGAVDITEVSTGDSLGNASSNTETEFASKIAIGALIKLSEDVSIDLNYQYVDLGKIKSGSALSFDSRDMVAPFSGPEITSSEFNIGLQILF
jgi:opacity protein-like surface antigen